MYNEKELYKKITLKKRKIFIASIFVTGAIGVGAIIALPIALNSGNSEKIEQKNKDNEISFNFELLQKKFNDEDVNKNLLIESDQNIDLSLIPARTLVKNTIIKEINRVNTGKLTIEEENAIKIETSKGIISYNNFLPVDIKINSGSKHQIFKFNFKRKMSSEEKLNILKLKLNKINKNKEIELLEPTDLDLSISGHIDKVKQFFINKIDLLNSDNKLTNDEKAAINIVEKYGFINYEKSKKITIKIAFGEKKDYVFQDYVFNVKRKKSLKEINQEKLNALKAKFEQKIDKLNSKVKDQDFVNNNLIVNKTSDIDLNSLSSSDSNEILKSIFNEINRVNKDNQLTYDETNATSIIPSENKKLITHTSLTEVKVKIAFGESEHIYSFKFTRKPHSISEKKIFYDAMIGKIQSIENETLLFKHAWFFPNQSSTSSLPSEYNISSNNQRVIRKLEQFIINSLGGDGTEQKMNSFEKSSFNFEAQNSKIITKIDASKSKKFIIYFKIIVGDNTSEEYSIWAKIL